MASVVRWHELNVGYFYGYILNLNENEQFVVGLRTIIILYIYHGNDRYLSQQQTGYPAC